MVWARWYGWGLYLLRVSSRVDAACYALIIRSRVKEWLSFRGFCSRSEREWHFWKRLGPRGF